MSVDQWGGFRGVVDATGPVGNLGDAAIGYRFVAAWQGGPEYFKDSKRDRTMVMPQFNLKYKGLTLRVYYSYIDTQAQQGTAFIMPNGDLNTIGGWKNSDNHTKGYTPNWETTNVFIEALQKISDNWESRISGSYYRQRVFGRYFSATNANYDNDTGTFIDRRADEQWNYWTVLVDFQGHYNLGPSNWEMANRDNFGFNFSNWRDRQAYWQTAPFPYTPDGTIGGKVVIPFGQTSGTILAPPSAFPQPAGAGLLSYVTQDALYFQHEIDAIPNWLTLVGCATWANIQTEQVANWSVRPYTSTQTTGTDWVYRVGGVLHLTQNLSLYGLQSTNFSTPLGTLLQNGSLAPNQVGKGDEAGVKWNFLGGKSRVRSRPSKLKPPTV